MLNALEQWMQTDESCSEYLKLPLILSIENNNSTEKGEQEMAQIFQAVLGARLVLPSDFKDPTLREVSGSHRRVVIKSSSYQGAKLGAPEWAKLVAMWKPLTHPFPAFKNATVCKSVEAPGPEFLAAVSLKQSKFVSTARRLSSGASFKRRPPSDRDLRSSVDTIATRETHMSRATRVSRAGPRISRRRDFTRDTTEVRGDRRDSADVFVPSPRSTDRSTGGGIVSDRVMSDKWTARSDDAGTLQSPSRKPSLFYPSADRSTSSMTVSDRATSEKASPRLDSSPAPSRKPSAISLSPGASSDGATSDKLSPRSDTLPASSRKPSALGVVASGLQKAESSLCRVTELANISIKSELSPASLPVLPSLPSLSGKGPSADSEFRRTSKPHKLFALEFDEMSEPQRRMVQAYRSELTRRVVTALDKVEEKRTPFFDKASVANFVCKVYPSKLHERSENYDPVGAFDAGAQLISLNMQGKSTSYRSLLSFQAMRGGSKVPTRDRCKRDRVRSVEHVFVKFGAPQRGGRGRSARSCTRFACVLFERSPDLFDPVCPPACDDTGYDGYMRLDAWEAARPTLLQKLSKENQKSARPWGVVSSKMSRWSQSKQWAQGKTEELATALLRLSPFSGRSWRRDRTQTATSSDCCSSAASSTRPDSERSNINATL